MEDVSSTSAAYTKDELTIFARHPVVMQVERIFGLQSKIQHCVNDPSLSKNDIASEIQEIFEEITTIWKLLGPSRALARRLFIDQETFFNVLDHSLAVQAALEDLCNGYNLRTSYECTGTCCKSVL